MLAPGASADVVVSTVDPLDQLARLAEPGAVTAVVTGGCSSTTPGVQIKNPVTQWGTVEEHVGPAEHVGVARSRWPRASVLGRTPPVRRRAARSMRRSGRDPDLAHIAAPVGPAGDAPSARPGRRGRRRGRSVVSGTQYVRAQGGAEGRAGGSTACRSRSSCERRAGHRRRCRERVVERHGPEARDRADEIDRQHGVPQAACASGVVATRSSSVNSWAGCPAFHFAVTFHDAKPSAWSATTTPSPWCAAASTHSPGPCGSVSRRGPSRISSKISGSAGSTSVVIVTVPGAGRNSGRTCVRQAVDLDRPEIRGHAVAEPLVDAAFARCEHRDRFPAPVDVVVELGA